MDPFLCSCLAGSLTDAIEFVEETGVKENLVKQDEKGRNGFWLAASMGNYEVLKYLVEQGERAGMPGSKGYNKKDKCKMTPLHGAVCSLCSLRSRTVDTEAVLDEVIRGKLSQLYADEFDVIEEPFLASIELLLYCIQKRDTPASLAQHTSSLDSLNVISVAARHGHLRCLHMLLFSQLPLHSKVYLKRHRIDGVVTALCPPPGALCGWPGEAVISFIKEGGECTERVDLLAMDVLPLDGFLDIHGRRNALWQAAASGHTDVVRALLLAGSSVLGDPPDHSPLFVACDNGHADTALLIHDNGGLLNLVDKQHLPLLLEDAPCAIADILTPTAQKHRIEISTAAHSRVKRVIRALSERHNTPRHVVSSCIWGPWERCVDSVQALYCVLAADEKKDHMKAIHEVLGKDVSKRDLEVLFPDNCFPLEQEDWAAITQLVLTILFEDMSCRDALVVFGDVAAWEKFGEKVLPKMVKHAVLLSVRKCTSVEKPAVEVYDPTNRSFAPSRGHQVLVMSACLFAISALTIVRCCDSVREVGDEVIVLRAVPLAEHIPVGTRGTVSSIVQLEKKLEAGVVFADPEYASYFYPSDNLKLIQREAWKSRPQQVESILRAPSLIPSLPSGHLTSYVLALSAAVLGTPTYAQIIERVASLPCARPPAPPSSPLHHKEQPCPCCVLQ